MDCVPVARFIVRIPILAPAAVGVKVTETVHFLPGPRVTEQVVVSAKSPVTVTPAFETAVLRVLVRVIG
jgi:hypothetical protein